MKLFEIIDHNRLGSVKKISNPELVEPISIENMNTQYKVGNVIFDNKKGLGATPNNAEIDYFGFTAVMKVSTFLKLASDHGGQREESAKDINDLLAQGYGIASPMLYVEIIDLDEDTMSIKISDHEGRARAICCQKFHSINSLPVHIMPRGFRAKHMTKQITDKINKIGIIPQDGGSPIKNPFESVLE